MRVKSVFIVLMIFFFYFSIRGEDISSELIKEKERLKTEYLALSELKLKIEKDESIVKEKGTPLFSEVKELNIKNEKLSKEIAAYNSQYSDKPLSKEEYAYATNLRQSLDRRQQELLERTKQISSDPIINLAKAHLKDEEEFERRFDLFQRDIAEYNAKLNPLNSKALTQARKISKGLEVAEGKSTLEEKGQPAIDTWEGNQNYGKANLPDIPPVPEPSPVYTKDSLTYSITQRKNAITELNKLKKNATEKDIIKIEKKINELNREIESCQKKMRKL